MKKLREYLSQLIHSYAVAVAPELMLAHEPVNTNRAYIPANKKASSFPNERNLHNVPALTPGNSIPVKSNNDSPKKTGCLRVGLAGYDQSGFVIRGCAQASFTVLAKPIGSLHTFVKPVESGDVATGLKIAMQMLANAPHGRTAILVLSSGQTFGNVSLWRKFVQAASLRKTAIHPVLLTDEVAGSDSLSHLATDAVLGFGKFRRVTTGQQLNQVIGNVFSSLTPNGGAFNSIIIVVDCSAKMQAQYGGTTRLNMVEEALYERLRKQDFGAVEQSRAWAE